MAASPCRGYAANEMERGEATGPRALRHSVISHLKPISATDHLGDGVPPSAGPARRWWFLSAQSGTRAQRDDRERRGMHFGTPSTAGSETAEEHRARLVRPVDS